MRLVSWMGNGVNAAWLACCAVSKVGRITCSWQVIKDRATDHWAGHALRHAITAWHTYVLGRRSGKVAAQRALRHWSRLELARVRT